MRNLDAYLYALSKILYNGVQVIEGVNTSWMKCATRGGFRSLGVGSLEIVWFPMGISIYNGGREVVRWSKILERDGNGVIFSSRYEEKSTWLSYLCRRIYESR